MHLLGGDLERELASTGQAWAIFGRNHRWTSFCPLNAYACEPEDLSKALNRVLLHLWFDEGVGVLLQVYDAGAFVGELKLPGDGTVSEADAELIAALQRLTVMTKVEAASLKAWMCDSLQERYEWTVYHGLESLLKLPYYSPIPHELPASLLRSMFGDQITVVGPKNEVGARVVVQPGSTRDWSPSETVTVDLHAQYWVEVWSLNNWKLYNHYKKHLPKHRRSKVDEICSALDKGAYGRVRQLVETVLAEIWDHENWDEIIRSPELVDNEPIVWRAWQRKLKS